MNLCKSIFVFLVLLVTHTWTQRASNFFDNRDSEARQQQNAANNRTYRIAIIGGGVGGTSAAYFLHELLLQKSYSGFDYEIVIYEQSGRVGGRLATVKVDQKEYEAGGSIIHERNMYAVNFANKFGLKKKQSLDSNDRLCIFNGEKFVFCENSWQVLTYWNALVRYGFDPYRLQKHVSKILDSFERIYELQEKEFAFEKVDDLLTAMDPLLANLTKISYYDQLASTYKLSRTFINEIAQAISLVNYGQTLTIPSFVGLVSFAGSGEQLWSVHGGNRQLPEQLARYSSARVLLNTKVTSVEYLGEHQYQVNSIKTDTSKMDDELAHNSEVYDYVIFATPLASSSAEIRFENFTKRAQLLNDIFVKYQMHQTVATFIKGSVLPKYHDLSILSCDIDQEGGGSFFTSISQLSPVDEERESGKRSTTKSESQVYKLFSNVPLKMHDLYSLFEDIEETKEVVWHAYPEYRRTTQPLPPFRIRQGAYYLNAIEWAASAIEMSLIGGKNVALLVCRDMKLCRTDQYSNITTTNHARSAHKVEL